MPESDATGASPGALPSVWPGALGAPSPCSVGERISTRMVQFDWGVRGFEGGARGWQGEGRGKGTNFELPVS